MTPRRLVRSSSGVASPSVVRRRSSTTKAASATSGFRSLYTGLVDATTGAAGINQIAYTWQLGNGITLNVGADDERKRSVANLSATTVTVGTDPTSSSHGQSHPDPWVALRISQAWGRASVAVLGHKNAATYYTSGGGVGLCTQAGTTLCNHPADQWGWAVVSGIEIKLDSLSPGSRIGGYVTYGQGASPYHAQQPDQPGPVRLRQPGRLRRADRRGLRQRLQPRADHDVGGGRRVRILLDP